MPEKVAETGLLVLLVLMQIAHLWLKRREARRGHEPGQDRRFPRDVDIVLLRRDYKALATRMDKAGEQMSELATQIQALPDEFRRYFTSKEIATEWAESCQRDRVKLWEEVNRLRNEGRGPRAVDRR